MKLSTAKTFVASRKSRLYSSVILTILIAAAVFTLFPVYITILNSFKTQGEMMNNIVSLPENLEFRNYIEAFQKTDFLNSLKNTIVIVGVGLIGIILFSAMAGYKLCRIKTRLSGFIFGLFVMSMLIPFHSIMISLTRIAKNLKVQGSTIGLGFIYIGLGVSMAIFLYHGFVKSISHELEEAAVIDGCGDFRLFFKIVFPLLLPITATVAILNMLWMWNDFLLPLIMLTDYKDYTLLLSTNMLFGQYGNNDWSAILSTLTMAMLPVILIYLVLQKYIIEGIAEGAVKG